MRPRQRNKTETIALGQFYKDVGRRVRDARLKASNMTQKALAVTVGLTRTSLTNIEKGRQKILLHTFTEIAKALDVDVIDLLPTKLKDFKDLGVNLPLSLAPEERGFIERAISSGEIYENNKTTTDRKGSGNVVAGKRVARSTS
jgi:DNA-binding XRE family transcriptional regulator